MRKLLMLIGLIALAGGCSSTLETGYKPRLLGDSEIRRRAYYAGQFTTEAKAAEQEQRLNDQERRPGPGSRY